MTQVRKRNGLIVDFDKKKIEKAILKAMKNGSGDIKVHIASKIADEIEEETNGKDVVDIKDIEAEVFNKLISKRQKLTARAYEGYRSMREYQRKQNTIDKGVSGLFDGTNVAALTENSNKNEQLISTGRDLVAEEVSKDYAKRKMLPPHLAQAHDEGIIHIHDLGHYMNPSFNCLESHGLVDIQVNGKCERVQLKDLYERYDIEPTLQGVVKEVDERIYIRDNKGWTKIKAVMARKVREDERVYTFKTNDGNSITFTGNHRVPVERSGKIELLEVKAIKDSDKLIYLNEVDKNILEVYEIVKDGENLSVEGFEKLPTISISSIEVYNDDIVVVDIETNSNYFVVNDYLVHNCCLVNLKDMLDNGTCINKKMIESPHRFLTACTIATQIAAQVSSGQFGGQTMSISHLAPYLRKSKVRIEKDIKSKLDGLVEQSVIDKLIEDRLKEELTAGVQTFNYQLNTLQTSNGQSPFLSLFMYIEEDTEYEAETAMIVEEFLKQRLQGMKNEAGAWVTPAFPKLLYVTTPNNIYEGSKYYYITELAAKCIAKRMMPDLISEKHMKLNYEGNVFPCINKICA